MQRLTLLIVALLAFQALGDTPPPIDITKLKGGSANGVITATGGVVSSVAPGITGNVLTSNGTIWTSAAPSGGGGAVASVNGQTGVVVLDTDDVSEGSTNLYYTAGRAQSAISASSPLTYSAGVVGCPTSSGSVSGCLASADFTTFANKQAAGNYITALTGDVSASGPGSVAATVNTVGGVSAANIASGSNLANAATAVNTPSTIVKRDSSGNFTATAITSALIGNVTGNVSGSAASFTGSLVGDVTGTQGATVVSTVGGVSAANVASGANAANAATSANTPSTIVLRNGSGDFTAGTITATLTGTASGNPPNARTISTTAPLTGGGDLSANRTIAMPVSTNSADGYLSAADHTTFAAKQDALTFTLPLLNTANTISINGFTGDTGAAGLKGAVPAPSINQGVTNKFLNAGGSWGHPGIRHTASEAVTAVSTWTVRSASAANQWFGITYASELGIFCSIASSGTNRVQWSRDGITWTAASAASAQVWTKLAWSPALRLFAAVAFDGTTSTNLMTSPDCRTWTNRTSTEASQWYDIVWAPSLGRFVAVSINGTNRAMYSDDGITWTASTPPSAQWYAVTWSDDLQLFAAVSITASGGNYAATSPDGITWTSRALTTGNTWYSVTWAKEIGLFVAVGATGTSRAATSPDGVTWTLRSIASSAWRRVKWSPEQRLLVAVSSSGVISSSPDGITWTARTSPQANQWYDLAWAPDLGMWAMQGITGTNRIQTSRYLYNLMYTRVESTPANTAEKVIRRDQNGSYSAQVSNVVNSLVNGAVAATNATIVNLNGHYKSMQTTAPVATVDANAGTGATCTLTNATDDAGRINITTGLANGTGSYCSIAFNLAHATAPICTFSSAGANIFNSFYIPGESTAAFTINASVAAVASTSYDLKYTCMETN